MSLSKDGKLCKMRIIFDTQLETLEVEGEPLEYVKYLDLYFAFVKNGSKSVTFNNLSFGYSLSIGSEVIQSQSYPPANSFYVSSDQDFLESARVYELDPDLEYILHFWVSHEGKNFSSTIGLKMPQPVQPFESWTWDSEMNEWMPPFLPPEDGNFYDWDEQSQAWIIVELDN